MLNTLLGVPKAAMYLIYGLIGLLVGSALNVAIACATARGGARPAFLHCPQCGARCSAVRVLPVIGHIASKGRCQTCGARRPLRALWVELSAALIFALLWRGLGTSWRLVLLTIYSCVLLVILVIDLEHRLVPNVLVLPAILVALLAIPLELVIYPVPPSLFALPMILMRLWGGPALSPAVLAMISLFAGGVISFGIFLLIWLIAPQEMGAGDVKLAAFAGLITGFPGAVAAVCGSFLLGGLAAIALLLSGKAGRKTTIPFAPFLCLSTFLALVFGNRLLFWYLGM